MVPAGSFFRISPIRRAARSLTVTLASIVVASMAVLGALRYACLDS